MSELLQHKLVSDLRVEAIPRLVDAFFSIVPTEMWTRRAEILLGHVEGNPFLGEHVRHRHALELVAYMILKDRPVALPKLLSTVDGVRFLSFAAMLIQMNRSLVPAGQTRLVGMLRDGLQSESGLTSIAHEVGTVSHLAARGFDVAFSDLETGGGFDFLATRRDGVEIEVECKTVSGDVGRQIHRRQFAELALRLEPALRSMLPHISGGVLAALVLPGRLDGQRDHQAAIADVVKRTLSTLTSHPAPEPCSVEVIRFDLAGTPFDSGSQPVQDQVRDFIERQFKVASSHILMFGQPRQKVIVVVAKSRKPDRVLRGIMRQLKDSAKTQFTRKRPGVLAVQLLDLTGDELLELAHAASADPLEASGLQIASNVFFDSPSRHHMHTIVYRSLGTPTRTLSRRNLLVEEVITESGPSYVFRNPSHPLTTDSRYRAF